MYKKNSPEIYDKIWVAELDDRTRPSHREADGQRAPYSGTFTVGGAELRYPGDPDGPLSEIENCRCHLQIVQHSATVMTADGAPSEQETEMPETDGDNMYRTFTDQAIALIGSPTSDSRMLLSDIDLSFRSFPLPLMWCKQSKMGHEDSFTVGVIEDARVEGDKVVASGYLLNTDEASEAANENAHGVSNPSVDLAAAEWVYTDEEGEKLEEDDLWDRMEEGLPIIMAISKAELIGTTLVATPAFDTRLQLDAERASREVAIVASAAVEFQPKVYDHRLFQNPNLSGPTLPTLGEDGRIYGHLAVFGQCHRSVQTECILLPHSPTNYSHFHTSPALRLDDGSRLPVGRLTVGTGHADTRLRPVPALAHYDNTGSCFALVRVGEDKHGVWFSGIPAPGASPETIEAGITAPLSGDWRDFGQGLELIAALAVNTPGFATRGRDDDQGRPVALVASMGPSRRKSSRGGTTQLSTDDIKTIIKEAIVEADARARQLAARDAALAKAAVVAPKLTPRQKIAQLLSQMPGQTPSNNPPPSCKITKHAGDDEDKMPEGGESKKNQNAGGSYAVTAVAK